MGSTFHRNLAEWNQLDSFIPKKRWEEVNVYTGCVVGTSLIGIVPSMTEDNRSIFHNLAKSSMQPLSDGVTT